MVKRLLLRFSSSPGEGFRPTLVRNNYYFAAILILPIIFFALAFGENTLVLFCFIAYGAIGAGLILLDHGKHEEAQLVSTIMFSMIMLFSLFYLGTSSAVILSFITLIIVSKYVFTNKKYFLIVSAICSISAFIYLIYSNYYDIPHFKYAEFIDPLLLFSTLAFAFIVGRWYELEIDAREKEMNEVNRKLSKIIDLNPSMIYTKGLDGNYTMVNQTIANVLRMPKEGIVGKDDYELLPDKKTAEHFEALVNKVIKSGQAISNEKEELHLGGGIIRYMNSIKSPLFNEEGKVEGIVGTATDITDFIETEKALRESETKYRRIFENSAVGIKEVDLSVVFKALEERGLTGKPKREVLAYLNEYPDEYFSIIDSIKYVAANQSMASLLECDDMNILQESCRKYLRPLDETIYKEEMASLAAGEPSFEGEVEIISSKGNRKVLWFTINFPSSAEEAVSSIYTYTDITSRKEAEAGMLLKTQIIDNLVHHYPALYYSFDNHGTFLESVGSGLNKLGLVDHQVVGLNVFDVYPEFEEQHRFVIENHTGASYIAHVQGEEELIIFDCRVFYDPEAERGFGLAFDISEQRKAERKLQESEERFRKLFEYSPFGIAIRDFETDQLIDVNEGMEKMFGFNREELLQMPRKKLTYWQDQKALKQGLEAMMDNRSNKYVSEKQYSRKNGSVFWARITRSLVPINNRTYLIGFIEDIDESKKAEQALLESEEIFRKLFENNPLAIAIREVDTEKVTSINPAFTKILGYEEEDIIGKDRRILTSWEDGKVVEGKHSKIIKNEIPNFTTEKILLKKNGDKLWCTNTRFMARIKNKEYIVGLIQDINDRKKAERALKDSVNTLNQRNEDLERYIESNMQLENFAYIASHDLREPLLTIIGFAKLLEKRLAGRLSEDELQYFSFIVKSTSNMERLIIDLLAFSRVNTKDNKLEEVKLRELLDEVMVQLQSLIENCKAKILIEDIPQKIIADRTKLFQLFQNLVSNGIKFNHPARNPIIKIKGEKNNGSWHFSVSDNGIGISKEYHEKIFLLFRRLHSRKHYEGSGIGLAICKKIVEHHGGKIWLESESGEGTSFHFTINTMKEDFKVSPLRFANK